MTTARRPRVITKSTSAVATVALGMISLGKYTFESRLVLLIRLAEDSDSALANSCHGSTAASTSNTSGTWPRSMPISRRNRTNTSMVRAGRISAHATPITVCL